MHNRLKCLKNQKILSIVSTTQVTNIFINFHNYLEEKAHEKEVIKGVLKIFQQLIESLQKACMPKTVSDWLSKTASHKHANFFKANRYHDLRQIKKLQKMLA